MENKPRLKYFNLNLILNLTCNIYNYAIRQAIEHLATFLALFSFWFVWKYAGVMIRVAGEKPCPLPLSDSLASYYPFPPYLYKILAQLNPSSEHQSEHQIHIHVLGSYCTENMDGENNVTLSDANVSSSEVCSFYKSVGSTEDRFLCKLTF